MTIQTEATKIVHDGTGSQDTFTFNFIVIDENDLSVYEDNVLTTRAYTLSGEGDPAGGEIVFDDDLDVPLAGTKVTLIREGEYKQETDYTAYGPFPAETHEMTIDKIVILVQQVKELIDRAFRLPKWDVTSPFEVTRAPDDDIESTVLGYDINGILTLMPISDSYIETNVPNPLVFAEPFTIDTPSLNLTGNLRFNGAGAEPTAFTGADTKIATGTKGAALDFAMWNSDGDIVGSGIAGTEINHVPDPSADLTGAGEIESVTVDTNGIGVGALLVLGIDGNWDEADADAELTIGKLAVALESGTGSKMVLLRGKYRDDAFDWTPGQQLYVGSTQGVIVSTKPTTPAFVQVIGFAKTADVIYFEPSKDYAEV
jgi:hypothetical protein